jgi:hypothetical protein
MFSMVGLDEVWGREGATEQRAVRAHAKALHGNPYDGHTLAPVIADIEKLTGVASGREVRHFREGASQKRYSVGMKARIVDAGTKYLAISFSLLSGSALFAGT